MKYVWHTVVTDVREKSLTVGGKKGSDGTTELFKESAGWWITFVGGISMYMGDERPRFQAGDAVRLSVEHDTKQESIPNASEETQS